MVKPGRQSWVCMECGASGRLEPDEDIDTKQCDVCGEPVFPRT